MKTIVSLLCTVLVCSTASALELTRDGKTDYRIVISAGADVSTKAVAEDMAAMLKEISGATFTIATDETQATAHEIIVGHDNKRLAGIDTSTMAIGAYEIKTAGEKLYIAGSPPRGSVNGMYGFLQDHLGVRYFTPGVTRLPKQVAIKVGDISDRQKPAFRWRSANAPLHWDGGWTARNRLNECKTYGGGVSQDMLMSDPRVATIGNYYSAHAFSYIPRELYDEHPEYYMERDGKRICQDNSNERAYCLSNQDFAKYMAERITAHTSSDDPPKRVGLGHADNGSFCRCNVCKTYYDTLGLAGTYMLFNNLVCQYIAESHPNVTVGTLSYGITFAPTKFKLAKNLFVTWCPISPCYLHGFDACEANRDRNVIPQLKQWIANTSILGVWYYHHQADSLMPHPRVHSTQYNLKLFRSLGLDGVFVEDYAGSTIRDNAAPDGDKLMPAYGDAKKEGYFTVAWGSNHIKTYIVAQLLWNPDYDVEQGIREFCETYFGAAGDEMAEFFLAIESNDSYAKTMGRTYATYDGVHGNGSFAPIMKWDVVQRMDKVFDEAERKVAGSKTLLRRVQLARLPLQLEILCFAEPDDPLREKAFGPFFALMEGMGFKSVYRTGVTYERKTIPELKAIFAEPHKLAIPGREKVGDNLLTNSSMEAEIDGDGIPDGWFATGKYNPEGYDIDTANVRLDDSKAHSGKRSGRLTKKPKRDSIVAVRQKFDVTPGERYRMKLKYQTKLKAGVPVIIFTKFDKDGVELGHDGAARGVNDSGDQWKDMQVDTTVESGTAQLMAEFIFYDDQAEGVAWIDDFTCSKVQK